MHGRAIVAILFLLVNRRFVLADQYVLSAPQIPFATPCVFDPTNCTPILANPSGIVRESSGVIYLSDASLHVVVKVWPADGFRLVAGNPGQSGQSDGFGTNAGFNKPHGLAIGPDHRVYVADTGNHCVRVATTNGDTVTFAGKPGQTGIQDGLGQDARFFNPDSLVFDHAGNLFVADSFTTTIRKISTNGDVVTFAGKTDLHGINIGDEPPPGFQANMPMAIDAADNLYVFHSSGTAIQKIDPTGKSEIFLDLAGRVTPLALGQSLGFTGLGVDGAGNLYGSGAVMLSGGYFGAVFRVSSWAGLELIGQHDSLSGSVLGPLAAGPSEEVFAVSRIHHGFVKLEPPQAPAIFRFAAMEHAASGARLRLEGIAAGELPLHFTWLKDGLVLQGATNTFLEIDSASTNDSGLYQLVVDNIHGHAASLARMVAVYDAPPAIDLQPQSQQVISGSNIVFRVAAHGSLPISYQWSRSGVPLSGETNANLVLPAPSAADAGAYTVAVSNVFGTLVSDAARLYPAGFWLGSIPTKGTATPGYTLNISISLLGTNGQNILTEWDLNGTPVTNGQSGTAFPGPSLSVPNFTSRDAGDYTLAVTNAAGDVIGSVPVDIRPGKAYTFETIAGRPSSGSVDGPRGTGLLNGPRGIVVTPRGMFVADTGNHTIRKISPDGRLETVAGYPGKAGNADGPGRAARFNKPMGLASDAAGNLYISDYANRAIRKLDLMGQVSTVASWSGPSNLLIYPDGPIAAALAADGTLYVADIANMIRKISISGEVSIFAGVRGDRSPIDGDLQSARFNLPTGIAVDRAGNIFVADGSLRKIDTNGNVTTPGYFGATGITAVWIDPNDAVFVGAGAAVGRILGDGTLKLVAGPSEIQGAGPSNPFWRISRDGQGADARIYPTALAGSPDGYLYAVDNSLIRKIGMDGSVSTLAGVIEERLWMAGPKGSRALAADPAGGLYVANSGESTISHLSPDGSESLLAGAVRSPGHIDGDARAARFGNLATIALDRHGNLYTSDSSNFGLRKLSADGIVTTVAGGGHDFGGFADGVGNAAQFGAMAGLAAAADDSIYVADLSNKAIRRVTPDGTVSTVASNVVCQAVAALPGGGVVVFEELSGTLLRISESGGASVFADVSAALGKGIRLGSQYRALAADENGNVYVTDPANHTVWKVLPGGTAAIVAGATGVPGTADGPSDQASFYFPNSLAADAHGNVFVGDSLGATIRMIDANGMVTTIAEHRPDFDGPLNSARLISPAGVARDRAGNLFVSETTLNTIRRIGTNGLVTTIAGLPWAAGAFDGAGAYARFSSPSQLAIDGEDNIYVADNGGRMIRKVTPDGLVTTVAGKASGLYAIDGPATNARLGTIAGLAADIQGNVYYSDVSGIVQKISGDGIVRTFAGSLSGSSSGYLTGAGEGAPEASITFAAGKGPGAVATDLFGNVYATDNYGAKIFKFVPGNSPRVLAGSSSFSGYSDGPMTQALIGSVGSMAADTFGNLLFTEPTSGIIRRVDPQGWVSTVAGKFQETGSEDGTGVEARFNGPGPMSIDALGNLYVVDIGNQTVRKGHPAEPTPLAAEVSFAGDTLVVDWLAEPPGYVLETSDSLQPGGIWTPVNDGILPMDNRLFFTAKAAESARFYRLRME